MPRAWEKIRSFISGEPPHPAPSRIPLVALAIAEQDRTVLAEFSRREELDVHFAESCDEAEALANRMAAPVILFDRDWPGTEWRIVVERLAALPHQACVILISGVSDALLLRELIRRGGYDIVPKPLRAENVARVVKLALSYWNSAVRSATL